MKHRSLKRILGGCLVGTAALSIVISAGLYISSVSFDWGMAVERQVRPDDAEEREGIFSSLENSFEGTYQYLARRYGNAAFFLLVFILAYLAIEIFEYFGYKRTLIRVLTIIPLLLSAHQFWWIVCEKSLRSGEMYWNEPLDSLSRTTFPLDKVCLFLILTSAFIVLAIEILNLREHFSARSGHA